MIRGNMGGYMPARDTPSPRFLAMTSTFGRLRKIKFLAWSAWTWWTGPPKRSTTPRAIIRSVAALYPSNTCPDLVWDISLNLCDRYHNAAPDSGRRPWLDTVPCLRTSRKALIHTARLPPFQGPLRLLFLLSHRPTQMISAGRRSRWPLGTTSRLSQGKHQR